MPIEVSCFFGATSKDLYSIGVTGEKRQRAPKNITEDQGVHWKATWRKGMLWSSTAVFISLLVPEEALSWKCCQEERSENSSARIPWGPWISPVRTCWRTLSDSIEHHTIIINSSTATGRLRLSTRCWWTVTRSLASAWHVPPPHHTGPVRGFNGAPAPCQSQSSGLPKDRLLYRPPRNKQSLLSSDRHTTERLSAAQERCSTVRTMDTKTEGKPIQWETSSDTGIQWR